jgi:4-amino-4-deoxy-L-arabinose transferase-like glycosyltransferase
MITPAQSTRRHRWLVFLGVTVVVLALLLSTAAPVGVTWDEPIYSQAAENAAHWFGTLLRGGPAAAFAQTAFGMGWGLVNEHPPLVRMLNGLGWVLTRGMLPPPTTHRVGSMALAAFTVGVLAAATVRRTGVAAGLFAAAAVVTMPRVFFHAHLGALDFAHAATWFLATLAFYHAASSRRWWAPLLAGLGLGLALLTKIDAVLLVPYWGLWLLFYRRRNVRAWLVYLFSLPVALVVLVAGWPWIWTNPVAGLVDWVKFFRVHFEIRQWYAGRLYVKTPWYLAPVMVGITTPVVLLILAFVGLFKKDLPENHYRTFPEPVEGDVLRQAQDAPSISGIDSGEKQPASLTYGKGKKRRIGISDWSGLHLLGILTVVGYYMLPITAIHDQERLLLPALLQLAVLAGGGFAMIYAWLARAISARLLRRDLRFGSIAQSLLGVGLAILLLLPGLVGIARLHPFELSYYNELVGGAAGAQRLGMETTYYASTYGYFLPELNNLPAGSKLWVMPNSWDVMYYYQRNGLLRDDLVLLRPPGWGSFYDDTGVLSAEGGLESADYALIDRRQTTFNDTIPEYAIQLEWARTKPELARLERDGVLLGALYSK